MDQEQTDKLSLVISSLSLLIALCVFVLDAFSKRPFLAVRKIKYKDKHPSGPRVDLMIENSGNRIADSVSIEYISVYSKNNIDFHTIRILEEPLTLSIPPKVDRRFIYYFNDLPTTDYDEIVYYGFLVFLKFKDPIINLDLSRKVYFLYTKRDKDPSKRKLRYMTKTEALKMERKIASPERMERSGAPII